MTTPAPTGTDLPWFATLNTLDEIRVALSRLVGGQALVVEARTLRSEDGENTEYDRALVELVTRILGLSHDEHGDIMTEMILR